jgi:hypothetical protein
MHSSRALKELTTEAFELVLHDGSHEGDEVEEDIAGIVPRLKRFGILLVHDVEQFALGPQVRRGLVAGIRRLRLRVSTTSLPYSDGLAIVRMEGDTGHARSRASGARPRCDRRPRLRYRGDGVRDIQWGSYPHSKLAGRKTLEHRSDVIDVVDEHLLESRGMERPPRASGAIPARKTHESGSGCALCAADPHS